MRFLITYHNKKFLHLQFNHNRTIFKLWHTNIADFNNRPNGLRSFPFESIDFTIGPEYRYVSLMRHFYSSSYTKVTE